jgi:hypothetical protein
MDPPAYSAHTSPARSWYANTVCVPTSPATTSATARNRRPSKEIVICRT